MGRLPRYAPMLAESGDLPADDNAWAYELKWDGVRAVVYLQDGGLELVSRNDRDFSVAYPELEALAAAADRPMVLDGEIVAFDEDGRVSFRTLQPRMHQRQPAKIQALAESTPVTLMLFDVLHVGDEPLIGLPYSERRTRLEALGLEGLRWAVPPALAGPGAEAFAESARLGMEGIVCKRLAAPYRPGKRDKSWTKVKNFLTQEVVVLGWTTGEGRRAGGIGSLLLGIPDADGQMEFVGAVGTGFTARALDDLAEDLGPLRQDEPPVPGHLPPEARRAQWVRPELVGEVVFAEWTGDGHLRHPSWRGLRPDKRVDQVRRES